MNRQQRGFTLLEIMIVLSLLAALMLLVGGAILGANRALLKADRYTASLDERRAAQTFLRSAIGQALPLEASANDNLGFFEGSAQGLQFVATLPGHLGGGIQRQRLELGGPPSDRRLQIAFAQVRGSGVGAWGEPHILLHGVHSLSLSYRGVTAKGEPTGWLAEWPWPERLPRAVRIDLQMQGPVGWPTEVVALRLDLSGATGG